MDPTGPLQHALWPVACLCLLCFSCVCQRKDQTYILIQPQVLVLSQASQEAKVRVVCRQLPLSPSVYGTRLTLIRRPLLQRTGSTDRQILADMKIGLADIRLSDRQNKASGHLDRELVLTMTSATCHDAGYSYTCNSHLSDRSSNSASASFSVAVSPPGISIRAIPSRRIYPSNGMVILSCASGSDPVGIQGATEGKQIRWVWEYNDGGSWLPVDLADVSGGRMIPRYTCFTLASPTTLKVRLRSLKKCSRRYRCLIEQGADKDVDNAQELLVSRGFDCNEGRKVLGTDPFVAIVGVLAVVAVVCLLAYLLYVVSSTTRRKQKEERQKQIGMRILTPMTQEQRDRLLKEKLEMQEGEETSTSQDPNPQSEVSEEGETEAEPQAEKEEKEEDVGDVDKGHKRKRNVKVFVEGLEETEEDMEGDAETLDSVSEESVP